MNYKTMGRSIVVNEVVDMATQAQYPYHDYNLYVVKHKKEGRRYAVLYPRDGIKNRNRTTVSYARYLMSVKEGRVLEDHEQVDHIDDDKLNDDLSNLQILSAKDNLEKENSKKYKQYVTFECPWCKKLFGKEKRHSHLVYDNKEFTSCSISCGTRIGNLRLEDYSRYLEMIADNVVDYFKVNGKTGEIV